MWEFSFLVTRRRPAWDSGLDICIVGYPWHDWAGPVWEKCLLHLCRLQTLHCRVLKPAKVGAQRAQLVLRINVECCLKSISFQFCWLFILSNGTVISIKWAKVKVTVTRQCQLWLSHLSLQLYNCTSQVAANRCLIVGSNCNLCNFSFDPKL